jgi:hypothetical protein
MRGEDMVGRFSAGGEEYRIAPATDLDTRRAAYELVYHLYREKGYADVQDSGLWCSVHHLLPDTVTLAVTKGDEMVGTLSVVFDGPLGLPADELYEKEINPLRRPGRHPSEIISLGVSEEVGRRASQQILVKLFNFVYLTAWYVRKSTDFVITVNPHHADYYKKTLLFEHAGAEKTYDKVGGAPAKLLHLALETPTQAVGDPEADYLRQRTHYRYFHTREEEGQILPELREGLAPMSEEEFEYFAMDRTDIWDRAGAEQRDCLSSYYLTALLARERRVARPAESPGADAPRGSGTESIRRRLSWHVWSFSTP